MSSKSINDLLSHLSIDFIRKLDITKSQANKLLLSLAKLDKQDKQEVIDILTTWKNSVGKCENCNALINLNVGCPFEDNDRDKEQICIVSDQTSLNAIENANFFKGIYFVLDNDIDEKRKKDIGINKLKKLIHKYDSKELVIATTPTIEGEMTAVYIIEELSSLIKTSRIGFGLSFGSNIGYANPNTIIYSFKNRKERKDE